LLKDYKESVRAKRKTYLAGKCTIFLCSSEIFLLKLKFSIIVLKNNSKFSYLNCDLVSQSPYILCSFEVQT